MKFVFAILIGMLGMNVSGTAAPTEPPRQGLTCVAVVYYSGLRHNLALQLKQDNSRLFLTGTGHGWAVKADVTAGPHRTRAMAIQDTRTGYLLSGHGTEERGYLNFKKEHEDQLFLICWKKKSP